MSNKSKLKYKQLCEKQGIPIFSQGWWLDAICKPQNWDVCIHEKGGEITGAWPYFKTSRLKQSMLIMPPLTKFLGVHINYPHNLKPASRESHEKEVTLELLKKLPYQHFNQNFHYSFRNWLPLYWAGFSQSTAYSYCIDESESSSAFNNFKSQTKRDIRKASEKLQIVEHDSPDVIFHIVEQSYSIKGKNMPYSLELLQSLDKACVERNNRKILLAKDEDDNIHAGIYLVWDQTSYYYLIGATDSKYKGSNANSLLIWHGIQEAINAGKIFDFEGSMIDSIGRFFRSFGAVQKPYFNLQHSTSKWLKIYFFLKTLR